MRRSKRERAAIRNGWALGWTWAMSHRLTRADLRKVNPYICPFSGRPLPSADREAAAWDRSFDAAVAWRWGGAA